MQWPKLHRVIALLLLVILAGLVVHAPLSVWLTSFGFPDYVKAWKEVTLGIAGLMLAFLIVKDRRYDLSRDNIVYLIGFYAVIHIISALLSETGRMAILAGLLIDLRYVGYFLVVYLFLRMYPSYKAMFVKTAIISGFVVVAFSAIQLVLPADTLSVIGYGPSTIKPYILLDDNPDYVRINGTMRGPNPLGAFAMGVFIFSLAYATTTKRKNKYLLGLFMILSLSALWFSYSRSAVLGLIVGVACLIAVKYSRKISRSQAILIALGFIFVGLTGYLLKDTSMFQSVILHDSPDTGAHITSDQAHASSLRDGLLRLIHQPFGAGIGSTGSASLLSAEPIIIENQYLMIAHEVGWLGLAVFIAIWSAIIYRLWQRRREWLALAVMASGLGLVVIGLVWPVLTDDPVAIIWWGLAGVAISDNLNPRRSINGTKTYKKTTRTT